MPDGSNALTDPLQSFLDHAREKLPVTGEVERYKQRFDAAGDAIVLLCDISSSMAEMAGGRRKIELLRDALSGVRAQLPAAEVIAFNHRTHYLPLAGPVPEPEGSTALHLALEDAARFRPRRTIVISDGRPDSEADALRAAGRLTGTIDVIYCGPDSDRQGLEFMQRLAGMGGGRVTHSDWEHEGGLALTMRRVLALPAPKEEG
jgi:Mg-chelatase subunit ChlD